MPRNHLASSTAACCWIPLFALRCEEARRPELASQPCALLAPDTSRRIWQVSQLARQIRDRKSTRLNSSHQIISYAVFCLKKKKKKKTNNNITKKTKHIKNKHMIRD